VSDTPSKTLADWPPRHPRAALLIAALLAILSLWGIRELRIDSSLTGLFPRDDPAAKALQRTLDNFGGADELLVLVSKPDSQTDTRQLLDFAARFAAAVNDSPRAGELTGGVAYRTSPQAAEYFRQVVAPAGLFYLNDEQFAAAQQRLTRAGMDEQIRRDQTMISAPGPQAAALSRILLEDPLNLHEFLMRSVAGRAPDLTPNGGGAFLSADGSSLLIHVTGRKPPSDLDFCNRLVGTISDLAERVNTDHLSLQFTGSYAIAAASQQAIRHDMIWSVVWSVVLLQLLFIAAYRRPIRLFALAFGPVAIGILYGFGLHAIFHDRISPITATIGAILAGMGIDYSIQYLSLYHTRRMDDPSATAAASGTIRLLWPALLAAWATSVVGFFAIGASRVGALRDFAILGTLGLAGAFFGSVFILPALLVVRRRQNAEPRFAIEPLLRFISHRWKFCIGAICILFLAALAVLIPPGDRLPLETDLTVMHPRPSPPLDALDVLAQKQLLPETLIVHLQAQSPEQLLELAWAVNDRLSGSSIKEAGVVNTFGLASLLPDPRLAASRRAAIAPGDADRVADDFQAAIAASEFDPQHYQPYAKFLHDLMAHEAAPTIADLRGYPSLAGMILPRDADANDAITLVFLDAAPDDLARQGKSMSAIRDALADLPDATLTGLSVVGQDSAQSIHRDLPRLILIALAVVAIYLLIHFRNLIDPLLALLPTIFSLTILLAIMRLTGAKLNMMNLIAFPLLIGIDVDYGIFLVSLGRQRKSDQNDPAAAWRRLAASGQAVLVCALATSLGFGSLVTLSIPAARSLGVAVAVGVLACLLAGLFLLAPILVNRGQRAEGRGQ
jgi:uncharacterized protein